MRKWVDSYLAELADQDQKLRLLIADVGDFPCFSSRHPEKFINVGVSESNCIGIASGMAHEGLHVYVYGVSSFFLYRAYEQLKYSVAYWNKGVTFIGVGFGWKYFNIGSGHFCPDDIALVKNLPNFKVSTPCTLEQLKKCLEDKWSVPRYIRITANIIEEQTNLERDMESDVIAVTYGEMAKSCIEAVESACITGHRTGLMVMDCLDDATILTVTDRLKGKRVVVIEDHVSQGGLFSRLLENNVNVIGHINLPQLPDKVAVDRKTLVCEYGMGTESIKHLLISS